MATTGRRFKYILLVALCTALGSCKKEIPQPIIEASTPANPGKYLLFDSDQAFNLGQSIYPMFTAISYCKLDGTQLTTVTTLAPGYYNYRARWSPDGSQVIFVSDNYDASDRRLYAVNIDGSNLRTITQGLKVDYGCFSPDGKKVAYTKSPVTTLPLHNDIYVANADGSAEQRVTGFGSRGGSVYDLNWASDGKLYFYVQSSNLQTGIYSIDPDGNNQKYILTDVYLLSISPDAKHILFDLGDGLYISNIDGTSIHRIMEYHNSGGDVMAGASWSADGGQIYFSNQDYPLNYGIFSINTNGNGLKKIMIGYFEFPQVF